MYMKIHVPSMLAIGVDKHTQQTTSSNNGCTFTCIYITVSATIVCLYINILINACL